VKGPITMVYCQGHIRQYKPGANALACIPASPELCKTSHNTGYGKLKVM
jgi:hypothetical protein